MHFYGWVFICKNKENFVKIEGWGVDKKTPTNFAGVSVVIPPRFERGTYCLEGSCSIQLSYGTFYSLVGMTRLERATPWSQTKYSAN